jgi:hypothetical protein
MEPSQFLSRSPAPSSQIITLSLRLGRHLGSNVSFLTHFTAPPHAELRHVGLNSSAVRPTAQDVLSMACLPRLSYDSLVGRIAEVEEARSRTRRLLSSDYHGYSPIKASGKDYEIRLAGPPLGPHQQEQMRQRVLDRTAELDLAGYNLLATQGGNVAAARSVFFAELRVVLAATGGPAS